MPYFKAQSLTLLPIEELILVNTDLTTELINVELQYIQKVYYQVHSISN